RHAQDVGCPLQERDVVLAELPLGPAVDLQHAVGRAIALKDVVHGASNAVLDQEFRRSKPLLILQVIADDWLTGMQGKPRRGFEISPDGCNTDDSLMPANTCANQQPILSRQVLQNLAKLRFHAFRSQASGLVQQLQEWPPCNASTPRSARISCCRIRTCNGCVVDLSSSLAPGSMTGFGGIGG